MIRATGTKNKKKMVVLYNGQGFFFNGEKDEALETILKKELEEMPVVLGTYCAEEPMDPLNIIGVLRSYFFDGPAEDIETDEKLETDWETGLVY